MAKQSQTGVRDFPFHIALILSYRTLSESIEHFLKPGALSPWPAALLSHEAGQRRPQLRRASGDRAVPVAAVAWSHHLPKPVAAAVLPRSSDGETLLDRPVGSNVGPRTLAGHIWDSSGTLASTPARQVFGRYRHGSQPGTRRSGERTSARESPGPVCSFSSNT